MSSGLPLSEPLKTTLNRPRPGPPPSDGGVGGGGGSGGPRRVPSACLLGLHPEDIRGNQYELFPDASPVRLGRHPQNDICIPTGDVSRRHCAFERRGADWVVEDSGSTNGTHVNDEPVKRHALASGDRITLGGPMVMFLAGAGMEARLIQAVQNLSQYDGLTSLPNKTISLQELERQVVLAGNEGTPLSVALLRLDDLENLINDPTIMERGRSRVGVDRVIRELAEVMRDRAQAHHTFGKYEYGEFVWVMPNTPIEEAIDLAEGVRRAVENHRFVARGTPIPVTVSGGVVQLEDEWDVGQLLQQTEAQLWTARQRANTIKARKNTDSRKMRRSLDGRWLLRKTLAQEDRKALVAFEVDDERSIVEHFGAAGHRNWLFELQQSVDAELGPDELLGTWKDRYIIATQTDDRPESIDAFAKGVIRRFQRWTDDINESSIERNVRTSVLYRAEVEACGERALDELVRKMLQHTQNRRSGDIGRLPHPLAVPHFIISNRSTSLARATALCSGIELYLKFVVAAELGWLRAYGGAAKTPEIVDVLRAVDLTQPLSMGAWLQLARRLARLFPSGADGVIPGIVTPLAAKRGAGSRLQTRLAEAVQTRNQVIHDGAGQTEEGYEREEQKLRETFDELTRTVRTLSKVRLVSVKRIESVDADDDDDERVITYVVRDHRGPQELFPSRRETTSAPMKAGWCYLVGDGKKPISLAPLFWSGVCEECRREEVFVGEDLWRGALRGDPTRLKGVTSAHPVKVDTPLGKRDRRIVEGWAAVPKGRELPGPDSMNPEEDDDPTGFFGRDGTEGDDHDTPDNRARRPTDPRGHSGDEKDGGDTNDGGDANDGSDADADDQARRARRKTDPRDDPDRDG